MNTPSKILEATTGYLFKDEQLLEDCLTKSENVYGNSTEYQRLEFLGDKVLNMTVSHLLFMYLAGHPEGILTQVAERFVKNGENMASVAKSWKLDQLLKLCDGDRMNGLLQNDRKLSDSVEVLLAGIWLDSKQDFSLLCRFVDKHWNISKKIVPHVLKSASEKEEQELTAAMSKLGIDSLHEIDQRKPKQVAQASFTCEHCGVYVCEGESLQCCHRYHPGELEQKACSNQYKCKINGCSNRHPCRQVRYWYSCCFQFVDNEFSQGCKHKQHKPAVLSTRFKAC